MLLSFEEEEETKDELADIAIQTRNLRAEKIKLQEKINLRQVEINSEIREMTNKLLEIQEELAEEERIGVNPKPKPIPIEPPKTEIFEKTTTMRNTERELYAAKQKLRLLQEDYNELVEKQKNEIYQLMRKAKRTKTKLEAKMQSIEDGERRIDEDAESNQSLQVKIHSLKRKTKATEAEASKVENEVMSLIQEAEKIVSAKYRGKSKHLK